MSRVDSLMYVQGDVLISEATEEDKRLYLEWGGEVPA